MEIIVGILAGVCIVESIAVIKLGRQVRENEDLMYKIGKVIMVEKIKNLEQGLENLFNPKDNNNGKNSKKVNDKVKHKN